MGTQLGLLSLTQQIEDNLESNSNTNNSNNNYRWMWNPKDEEEEEDEDSWEVKAFEQDTGNNIVTWPPRSYTCTFCRREFRSAQALGGHMNVHRRDRARLHQTLLPTTTAAAATPTPSSTALLIPTQEFGDGLCVLYSLPNPNNNSTLKRVNSCMDSPSTTTSTTLLSISPFEPNNLAPTFPPPPPPPPPPTTTTNYPNNFPVTPNSPSICRESSTSPSKISNVDNWGIKMDDSANEELDLELRLGRR